MIDGSFGLTPADVKILGLTVKNGGVQSQEAGGGIVSKYNNNLEVENCIIHDNTGVTGGGTFAFETNRVSILNTLIKDNYAEEMGGGIGIHGSNNFYLVNSIVINNSVPFDAGGVLLYDVDSSKVVSTTIGGNTIPGNMSGTGLDLRGASSDHLLIFNSVISQNKVGDQSSYQIINRNGGTIESYYSMIGNNDINAVYEHFSNITSSSDPFVDIWNGNGNLADYSSGIGTGALSQQLFSGKTVTSPLLDFYGNPRPFPIGSNPDMGAIENIRSKKLTKIYISKEE